MRKLKLQVQMSVDGYIAGPNGEMDWMMMEDGIGTTNTENMWTN
jgi:dihydrofolate reductase